MSYFPSDKELDALLRELELGSGDRIEVLVHLRRPGVYRNPGVFDYRRHLERRGIYWTGSVRSPRLIQVVRRGWHGPDRLRNWATKRIGSHFEDDPTIQALALGMVLGQRRRLPADAVRKFQAAGLIHLLVVSGFNLALVGAAALWAGRRIRFPSRQRTSSLLFALGVVWGYAFLVEGNAPVLRATLMASFMLIGTLLDRGYAIGNALSATAITILILDPLSLGDPSFQLTFAAVLGILLLVVPLIRWSLGWIRPALRDLGNVEIDSHFSPDLADWRVSRRLWYELRGWPLWVVTLPWRIGLVLVEALLVTVGVQSVLLGLMVESYHRMSPVAVPLNVVGALVAAVITPSGLCLLVLPEFLAGALAWVMTGLLKLLVVSVDWGLELPGATMRVPSPPGWIWLLYGIILAGIALALHRRSIAGFSTAGALLATLQVSIAIVDFSPPAPEHPTLTFIDVGQGDSTLIELPNGRRIVVDGGGVASGSYRSLRNEGTFRIGEDIVSTHLFSRGLRRLDTVVLTHAHHDHMDGLFDLIQNFGIGEVWLGPNPRVPRFEELLEEIDRRRIPIRWIAAGDILGPFYVHHPPRDHPVGSTAHNDDSVVLMLETRGTRVLLPGDLETNLQGLPEGVDVLKVPHHGSRNTRLEIGAGIRVISVGANNRFGHPDASKLPALRTDVLGAIRIVMKPGHPEVSFPGL